MVTCIIQPILILLKLHNQTHNQLHNQAAKNEIFPLKSPLSSPSYFRYFEH